MFTPSTNLRLLNVPLEAGYSDTLWFPDVNTQTQYFLGKVVKAINDFNFIKKDNTITINGNVETYYNCNYIMYQNANFSNKWFYAFINKIEWASNSSTRLYCSTDCIQTWFFDITYYQSFIERQHSTTDTPGDNIVPEPFQPSQPCQKIVNHIDLQPVRLAIFATCQQDGSPVGGNKINGIYSGAGLVTMATDVATANATLNAFVNNGVATGVVALKNLPAEDGASAVFSKHPATVDGYPPVNKKLLSGAFITSFVSCMGQSITFNPEFCSGDNVQVKGKVDETSGSMLINVVNYAKHNEPYDAPNNVMSLVVKFPDSTWAYNTYQNDYNLHSQSNAMEVRRLQQHQSTGAVTKTADTVGSAFSGIMNLFGLNFGGAAGAVSNTVNNAIEAASYAGGYDEITQQLQAISESYNAPVTGSIATSNGYIASGNTYLLTGYNVPPYQLAVLYDHYLTVYGYAQNNYGVPNLHARKTWTFIKVNDLRASGAFPNEDLREIRKAFNKGIFFWDYSKVFGNFGQDNTL